MYVKQKVVQQHFDVAGSTLRRWANAGLVDFVTLPNSQQRLYNLDSVARRLGVKEPQLNRRNAIYARVSSAAQRADLERQLAELRAAYPDHRVYQDVASGLNFHRSGFQSLLDDIHQGAVGEVVVMHRDRLCRFAYELVEWICQKAGTRIVVHTSRAPATASAQQELAEDLLAVVNVFVARNNGRRSAENRRRRQQALAQAQSTKHRRVTPANAPAQDAVKTEAHSPKRRRVTPAKAPTQDAVKTEARSPKRHRIEAAE